MEKNVIEDGEGLISRREALKKMGAATIATTALIMEAGKRLATPPHPYMIRLFSIYNAT